MRIATAILIVLAGVTVAEAQQIERPPFYPPPRDVPNRPLFPQVPFDSKNMVSLPARPTAQPIAPQPGAPQTGPQQRSGSVCLKSVPVDPSVDRAFVLPIPDTRSLPMRIIGMPSCVTLGPQQQR